MAGLANTFFWIMMSSAFEVAARSLVADMPDAVIREWVAGRRLLFLPGNRPPWQATGLKVKAGQSYSLFADGRIGWSRRDPSLHGGPRFHLWARVAPGGRIANLTADTGTFVADRDGAIELGIYMGRWRNDRGELATSTALYEPLSGAIQALVVVWRQAPAVGLAALTRLYPDAGFLTAERGRLAAALAPPPAGTTFSRPGRPTSFARTSRRPACGAFASTLMTTRASSPPPSTAS